MKNIAILTARGGSKRIPRKNIKDFLGKPMISYPIEAALESGLFDDVIVSTDDDEIASIAIKYGASVPFKRSAKTSDDFATTFDVLNEVVNKLSEQKIHSDNICCIYPTSPFLTSEILCSSFKKFQTEEFDSLVPVVKFDYPPQRALKVDDRGKSYWADEKNAFTRSQDLETLFHDVGQFYWIKEKVIFEDKKIITQNSAQFEIEPLRVQDIDTPEDWKIAEIKYKYINNLL